MRRMGRRGGGGGGEGRRGRRRRRRKRKKVRDPGESDVRQEAKAGRRKGEGQLLGAWRVRLLVTFGFA
jgi:hypothetical protein